MKLYYAPGACSLSPHIVLLEAGLDFELEKVDLKARKTEHGEDFMQVNAHGYVPALKLDDGTVLTEGPAIVQYLADRTPGAKLAPANGSIERYQLQAMLNFISTELHKQFSPLFDPSVSDAVRQAQLERIGRRFDWLERRFASGKPFIMGDAYTVADAYLYTILNWAGPTKIGLDRWPKLKEYRQRIAERPRTQQALKAEGLVK